MPHLEEEYTLLQQLGTGGFATVYKARHNQLGYVRAIRMLNAFVPDEGSEVYQKFLRECRVLLRLGNGNHPNIVHVYQPRLVDGHALVEMDYVEGVDLVHFIKQRGGFMPLDEVLRMVEEISSAMAYCHHDIYHYCMDRRMDNLAVDPDDGSRVLIDAETEQRLVDKYKVIHNDIHSGNIMRRFDGHYVLLDFGLAIEGGDVVHSSRHENGAPEYKAPEKWDNDTILTEQSDIYSFGVVMYECLAGRVPFPFDKMVSNTKATYQVSEAHKNDEPAAILPLRKAAFTAQYPELSYTEDYPQWLEEVVMKCLSKNPTKRYKNGAELHEAIEKGLASYRKPQQDPSIAKTVELFRDEVGDLRHTIQTLNETMQHQQKPSDDKAILSEIKAEVGELRKLAISAQEKHGIESTTSQDNQEIEDKSASKRRRIINFLLIWLLCCASILLSDDDLLLGVVLSIVTALIIYFCFVNKKNKKKSNK
ncbi:MAG: serine/threonine protein kinase [Bacteroidales bacterium]|nr:serine/threonine protein kinase [Bacteroidales bacterium]